jgi:serine/threonine protein phosphatase PrpC
MLTLVEAISLAGDRAKQNDDAFGHAGPNAWVIDGATDLHETPLTFDASDASWLARYINLRLTTGVGNDISAKLREISHGAAQAFATEVRDKPYERWQSPTASVLVVREVGGNRIYGGDLGDCRCFALDADGGAHAAGSRENGTDDEQQRARDASKNAGSAALLRDPGTMAMLRAVRAQHNLPGGGYWVFGLQPECADHARHWTLDLKRPAHLLLCTDGFSALVDRYRVYDAAGLVRAALDKGLHELGRELRAIEASDATGAQHPRFKRSDDATALLLRLS